MERYRTIVTFLILNALYRFAWSAVIEVSVPTIIDDVILEGNATQKIIRVNPLNLPTAAVNNEDATESALFKIQPLLVPPPYVLSKEFRKPKTREPTIIRPLLQLQLLKPKRPKQKQLHILYNQQGLDGETVARRMKVRVAPGAYPIYYILTKTNGLFRKQPIKSFQNQDELDKYFNKASQIGKLSLEGS